MSESPNKPLLTFAIAAFNQEQFIREAVEGALGQTYSPLEVVLSDDCSEDRTFQIMQKMAAEYKGPHKIILNRNRTRRSLGGHINAIVGISHGELIIGAAGDDIALPGRTQAAYDAWEWSGRRATSIHSDFIQIDEAGSVIERVATTARPQTSANFLEQQVKPLEYIRTLEPVVFGCAHTFSRQLFRTFGDLPEHIVHEDNAMAFRSALCGKIVYISQPLVKYRIHGNNIFIRNGKLASDLKSLQRQEDRFRRYFNNREAMYQGFLTDLEKAKSLRLLGQQDFEQISSESQRLARRFTIQREFLALNMVGKCQMFPSLRKEGLTREEVSVLARRIMPRAILLRARLARQFAGAALGRSR